MHAEERVTGFGALLRRYRVTAGLSQEALAERAGLSRRGIADLERGARTSPYGETIRRLADALGLDPVERAALLTASHRPPVLARSTPSPAEQSTGRLTNLPAPRTRLIGREADLEAVRDRVLHAPARSVTLVGAGGSGKTALALEAARGLLSDFEDGVWLVELAALADPTLVPQVVASVFGVREGAGRTLQDALAAYLEPRSLLLVVDNAEHLIEAVAALCERLLAACSHLRLLVTSRESLRIRGELSWRVPTLAVPDPRRPGSPEELEQFAGVQLFAERAAAAQPTFGLTPQNANAVASVCARLDGIPLALELAGARTRTLTAEQILERLGDSFGLLSGGPRGVHSRQQTMRATLDWSHALLSEAERMLFRRLAVFAGGWDLDAAEAVCSGDGMAAAVVLDLLDRLVEKSLVLVDATGAVARYRLLETVRQYAEDQLLRTGEGAAVRYRHRDWCFTLRQFSESDSEAQVAPLLAELDNVRAALSWCATDDPASGLALICRWGLGWGWIGGSVSESRRWLETFLARAPESTASRAAALLMLGHYLRWLHRFAEAARASDEALAIYVALHNEGGIALARGAQGLVAANCGDYTLARRCLDEALASARRRGDIEAVAQFLRDLAVSCMAAADFAGARAALTESTPLCPRGSLGARLAELRLAILDRLEGEHDRAHERLLAAGTSFGEAGTWATIVRLEHANQARAAGRFDEARASIIDVLRADLGSIDVIEVVAMLGVCEIAAGAHARGVILLGAASNVEGPIGTVHMPDVRVEAPIYLERARAALGEVAYASAWAAGKAMALDQVFQDRLGAG
jgi:predicted ATPase/transcriptional regulator with XRE-family HTH domain